MKPVTQDEAKKNTDEMVRTPVVGEPLTREPLQAIRDRLSMAPAPAVCKHGSLRRQCYVCDLEEDLDRAYARIATLEADIERYRINIDKIARILSLPSEDE